MPGTLTPDLLPLHVLEFCREVRSRGGRAFLIGGSIRDALRGSTLADPDLEVFGLRPEVLEAALAQRGHVEWVGRSFGVYKWSFGGTVCDISLPRRDRKTGPGHKGFLTEINPNLPLPEAAARRDFTINALYFDPLTDSLEDPLSGIKDLENRILRHTGPAFADDPLRVLRGMQLAARLDFSLHPATAEMCRTMQASYTELPPERIWGEWSKFCTLSKVPSRGLEVLAATGWDAFYPELLALQTTRQDPVWHPEGTVWRHTAHCLDALAADRQSRKPWSGQAAAERVRVFLAVLCHDLGKVSTTKEEIRHGRLCLTSTGHDVAGGPLADSLLERIGMPPSQRAGIRALVENHMVHLAWTHPPFPGAAPVRRLAQRLHPATIDELCMVLRADASGRPPLSADDALPAIERLEAMARRLEVAARAPKPLLLGRHLLEMGWSPGPGLGRALREAFEAQIEGKFQTVEEGLDWIRDQREGDDGA